MKYYTDAYGINKFFPIFAESNTQFDGQTYKSIVVSTDSVRDYYYRVVFDEPQCGSYIECKSTGKQTPLRQSKGVYYLDLWMRPGEQSIPTVELGKSPLKRRRAGINELQNLKYLPRASIEREITIEDRTPAHADHVGFGVDRHTTAAVGVLKAIHCETKPEINKKNMGTTQRSQFYVRYYITDEVSS